MNEPKALPISKDRDVRDYLAAEQTFLAWIRTGLALMGFGFVVARFGLFLQEIHVVALAAARTKGGLRLFGTALIVIGVVVDLFASWHHVRLVHQLNHGETDFTRPSRGSHHPRLRSSPSSASRWRFI